MRTRHTLIYALIFGLLLAAYVTTGRIERRIERREYESRRLFDFEAAAVRTLSIERPDETPVEAYRDDSGSWSLVSPHRHIPPNAPIWNQLAEIAAGLTNERPIESENGRLELFDLDRPKLVVRMGTRDGTLTQVSFGSIDPTRRHRYARVGTDDAVFLTPAEAFFALNRPLDDLRERRVFPAMDEGLTAIEYRRAPAMDTEGNATPEIRERYVVDVEGVWWIESPIRARANQARLRALAEELSLLRGSNYIDAPSDLGDYGLDQPFATVTPYAGDTSAGALAIGWLDDANDSALFTKTDRTPTVFTIDTHLIALLPTGPLSFRERRLFTGEASGLERIVYRDVNREIALATDTERGWHIAEPDVGRPDQLAISSYIAALKTIEGNSFPDAEATGLDSPRVEIELHAASAASPRRIRIGNAVPGADPLQFFAETDFGEVTTIGLDEFRLLQASVFRFRDKGLFGFEPAEAEIVEVTVDGQKYGLVRQGRVWIVAEPEDHVLESQADANDLLTLLAELQMTDEAVPVPGPEATGLSEPVLIARVFLRSGPAVGPLTVGNLKAEQSRDRFVTVAGLDGVFYVDQSMVSEVRNIVRNITPTEN